MTLSDVKIRTEIAKKLSQSIDSRVDCICGVESGGSYYASIIADKLKKPLILFRKHEKKYAERGKLVGNPPSKDSTVAIIDDVVVSGLTLSPVVNHIRNLGCKVKIFTIFSYGLDQYVEKRLKTKIISLANLKTLLSSGVLKGYFTKNDVDLISEFTHKQQSNIQQFL
jgi:orotate phosphoribosyltransferase